MNPNQTRSALNNIDINSEHNFPLFVQKLNVKKFRSIKNLSLEFIHPITVLTGTNKIGKTSVLAMLACSHVEFQMRDSSSGLLERCTWSRLVKFTKYDIQNEDWEYSITNKNGRVFDTRIGKRLLSTKKWSGVAKKESQIEIRKVVYIDLDRINPARSYSNMLFLNTQRSSTDISVGERVKSYFSYVFEETFELSSVARHQNKEVFKFNRNFTNFNSASGEDVILAILLDAVQADNKSLVLIDELELGLHPKIQRRLADVILDIAKQDQKQFIVTTHSPTLLSFFDQKSRLFIQKDSNSIDNYRSISKISIPAAFSKMDSEIYPLINLFYEDDLSRKLLLKAFDYIISIHSDIQKIVNMISCGAASNLKKIYEVQAYIHKNLKVKTGYVAVFDGDQNNIFSGTNPAHVFFLFSNNSPEKFLLENYLKSHPNTQLTYHLNNTNVHVLFDKCVEQNIASNTDEVFELLYSDILNSAEYKVWLNSFKEFILSECKIFSEQHD